MPSITINRKTDSASPLTGGDSPTVALAPIELCQLQRDLLRAITSDTDKESMLSSIGVFVNAAVNPVAMRHYVRDDKQRLAFSWQQLFGSGIVFSQALQEEILNGCNTACSEGCLQIKSIVGDEKFYAVAVPIFLRKQAPEAIALVLPATTRGLERTIVMLQLVASYMTLWYVLQESAVTERDASTAAALLEIMERLGSCNDLQHACYALVGDLKEHLGWDEVALGLCQGQKGVCRLQVISGQSDFDKNSERTRAFDAAFDESILRDSLSEWPPSEQSPRHATRALERLCSITGSHTVVSAPLHDEQREVVGAWIFLVQKETLRREFTVNFIRASSGPVGATLQLVKRADRSRIVRLARTLIKNRRTWQAKAALVAACLLSALLAVPMHYKVKCHCEIQPVMRRYVVAPFDGRLEKALVAPGDVIVKGNVLARINGRDLHWELTGRIAEYGRATKRRDAAMAAHDVVASQLAKLEMEQLKADMDILKNRAENLEIKSPIDGIVISGDQERAEGAPLTVGQSLFEIAPLDKMIVEVAVPENEINFVEAGLDVTIRLDSFPRRTWTGTIRKVHPRAEIRDDENVFIAEVYLDNPDDLLRPGMNGRAKVISGRRPLAWNLFHKPWETMLTALGW